ncbi:hypothetical protein OPV22_002131 [Ensete ventricosum]|uniref:NPH3 domain-containing protein n=1 Tax=Ensete ventricosum TaxID=4639 RepID=A0AAV8RX20_ENSVE|nr:hypothetical protein OPV22_002131 [Ensete ventricosum]
MVGFCCGVQWTPSQNTLHGREAGTRGFVGSTTSARSAECTPGADEQQTEAPAMAVGGRGSAAYSLHAVLSRPPNPRLRRQAALLDRSLVHRTESNPTFAVEFLLRPPAWIKGYQDVLQCRMVNLSTKCTSSSRLVPTIIHEAFRRQEEDVGISHETHLLCRLLDLHTFSAQLWQRS